MAKKQKSAKRGLGGVVDGTTYNDATDPRVVQILERARTTDPRQRLCVRYGDTETGRDWGDPRMCGTIGRSTGTVKIPLLIPTARSMGGEGLLEAHIVRITEAGGKRGAVLYSHPKYHKGSTLSGVRKRR
jgi:hypothetical protein